MTFRTASTGPSPRAGWLLVLAATLLAWRFWLLPRLGITLYVDEAQYWTWAQDLDWGYYSKPPGVAALIWLSTALFGQGLAGVKALSMLCYPLAGGIVWALARRLYDDRVAFWSAAAVLTLPIFSWLGLFVSTDALLTVFWSGALLAYLRALDHDRWGDWLLLGLLCGLGLMSKYTMAAWLGAAFLHLLFFCRDRLRSAKPWLAAGLAAALLAPNILWNIAHDFPTLKHTADITLRRHNGGGMASLAEFWGAQWASFGPVLGTVFFILLLRVRESWRDENTRLLLWFALPLWAVVSAQAIKGGANANWAAPAFAPAVIAATAWLLARQRRGFVIGGLIFNLVFVGLAYHWSNWMPLVSPEKTARMNPYKRAVGWDVLGSQLATLTAAHPQAVLVADNRTLLAHMLYELRDQQLTAASWNPSGEVSDHYKLTTRLQDHVGQDVVFISTQPLELAVLGRFAVAEAPLTFTAPFDGHNQRILVATVLHDFKGY